MPRPTKLGELTPDEWTQIQAVLDRFERAWEGAAEPDLAAFLGPPEDRARTLLLHELVKSDLEARWRRGSGPHLEDYLRRFPELGEVPDLLPALAWEEYRVRRRYGDAPTLDSYRERFPVAYPELERRAQQEPEPAPRPPAPKPAPPTTPSAPSLGMTSPGATLAVGGGYRLTVRLGRGTFGEVWRAQAPGGVEVAIKVVFRPLDDEQAQRELEGLNLIKNLCHPFLMQTHAFWALEDRVLIVMELAEGSLRDRLKASVAGGGTGIPVAELLPALRQACEALDYLHGRRVLHRDVKPDNLLLRGGYVKLADMGLARVLETQRSFTGTTCGSPVYMAPEVWSGRAGAASDLYSLAVAYVELRRGRPPFAGVSMVDLMFEHMKKEPDLAGLTPAEQAVLRRALAKDPASRPGSCMALYRELEDAVAPCPGRDTALPELTEPAHRRGLPRVVRLTLLVLLGLLLLLVPAAVVALLFPDRLPRIPVLLPPARATPVEPP